MAESDETASRLAKELLEKSDAGCVEVWSDGRLISRVAKPELAPLSRRRGLYGLPGPYFFPTPGRNLFLPIRFAATGRDKAGLTRGGFTLWSSALCAGPDT